MMNSVVFQNDTPFEVFKTLDDIGIQQHLLGYEYLAYAIKICMDSYPDKPSVTREIYPSVAKMFDTTATRVERAIRHSIDRVFITGKVDVLYKYFGNSIDVDLGKVSNSQFMFCIASKLRLGTV